MANKQARTSRSSAAKERQAALRDHDAAEEFEIDEDLHMVLARTTRITPTMWPLDWSWLKFCLDGLCLADYEFIEAHSDRANQILRDCTAEAAVLARKPRAEVIEHFKSRVSADGVFGYKAVITARLLDLNFKIATTTTTNVDLVTEHEE